MHKLRFLLFASVLLLPVTHCFAQWDAPTVDSHPTSSELQAWISGNDPRTVAWAAYFANRSGDPAFLDRMPDLLDRWMPSQKIPVPRTEEQNDTISEILDALIVHNRKLSPGTLSRLVAAFPAQAAILVSRLPLAESTPLLLQWYSQRKIGDPALPRIAAMLLSKQPPPGFAASVLADAEQKLNVTVLSPNPNGMGRGFGERGR